jgi:GT2 family glycosyltransferase
MKTSPIALFVYNRKLHTDQTVTALKANTLSANSDLFIFSDAAKEQSSITQVQEVREYVKTVTGFRSVTIVEREENFGLAKSIVAGVTELTKKYGQVIVLEDDLVTSKYFLQYMNDALNQYVDQPQVMHISGYMFPIDSKRLPSTYFLRTASCWGWATWHRAWINFEKSPESLIAKFNDKAIRRFNMDGTYDFWKQVLMNQEGKISTWAIFWYASVFQHRGLCLHPAESMVINIGNDGSGMNCGKNDSFNSKLYGKPISFFEPILAENELALRRTKLFFLSLKPSVGTRIYRRLKNLLIKVL